MAYLSMLERRVIQWQQTANGVISVIRPFREAPLALSWMRTSASAAACASSNVLPRLSGWRIESHPFTRSRPASINAPPESMSGVTSISSPMAGLLKTHGRSSRKQTRCRPQRAGLPHPCESGCNRVLSTNLSINSVERFIGDYAIEKTPLPQKESFVG